MNEISKPVAATSPPKPVAKVVAEVTKASKGDAPTPEVKVETPKKPVEMELQEMQAHVEAAVAQMNAYIQSSQRDLHFTYDASSGETVVKVLDRQTQEVIRQIPDAIFLKIANQKDANGTLSLFSAQA